MTLDINGTCGSETAPLRPAPNRVPMAVLGTLSVAALGSGIAIYLSLRGAFEAASIPNLDTEILRFALQVFSVTVLGTIGTLLVSAHNREHNALETRASEERRRAAEAAADLRRRRDSEAADVREHSERIAAFKRNVLSSLIDSYAIAKKVRRLGRASVVVEPTPSDSEPYIDRNAYMRVMEELNVSQLALERIVNELETSESLFVDSASVTQHVKVMEKYLRRIIREFEEQLPKVENLIRLRLANLPRFAEFGRYYGNNEFDERFVSGLHAARDLLRAEIRRSESRGALPSAHVTQQPAD